MKTLEGWEERLLGELVVIQGGFAFRSSDFEDDGIPIIRMSDLKDGRIDFGGCVRVKASKLKALSSFSLNSGDFLVGMSGSIDNYAIVRDTDLPAYLNQRVGRFRLRDNNLADYGYIVQIARSHPYRLHVGLYAAGAAQVNISPSQIESFRFMLPPKHEQSKIAEILSTVDLAIEQTEALIAKQERIKTGLMQDLLTRGIDEHGNLRSEEAHQFKDSPLGRIPSEWEVQALSSRASIKGGKRLPPGHGYAEGDTVYRYLQTTDFINKHLNYNRLHHLFAKTFRMLERYEIIDGDVFISIAGVNLGVAGIFCPDFDDRTILTENAARIHILTDALPEYLAIQINGPLLQRQILEVKGIGAGVPKLALFRIQQLLVAWPCMEEQQRIVRRLQSVNSFIQKQRKELGKMQSLKTALMQDLLTGKVRVTPLLDNTEVMSE